MTITVVSENAIATITIDRQDKLNALDVDHLVDLRLQLSAASSDPSVRVIVITGAGQKAFCVGADLTSKRTGEVSPAEAFALSLDDSGERGLYIRLFDLSGLNIRKPLIAAVNGFCLGGGLELALQCDLILASETASFGLPEVIVSSLPGGGGVPNLLRAIPRPVAMRMLLTGERIDASRALEIGLVSDITSAAELAALTGRIANRIGENGPVAVQLVKMLAVQCENLSASQAFQLTELAWSLLRDTEDRKEGKAAFAEKRKPQYAGR
ncbi:enoyl-CoA hydratase/isomerase family protein [Rhizobium leguminosarum]|uniref:enoyl-CoA hydratase/isomerase family protein n=1 Tax=Rhizobium TaxID=379 RepID=UPI0010315F45|nr:enoyl-CoA hydratase-related protein [Rhizobium leguminosarum]TBF87474.1 enoyl-CoA hydratase/isomerase family protein [Rhizobium leguminosarum]TBG07015.1 enoyl-CoA hydratase/isomerase family protein [Rhizobium leguminosarum]TBG07329.1 enoyl-CoA hydratase/isomerase family protein [Rhizobium leguminosarum]TBG30706.1 enoyl-CoA hydratase/isomerase family protein [Rhizobium leguminosarum]TBG49699.1 enoyl-CoA hydratase/isomerase family protein [Rhizobium leguminosarum]